MRRLVVLPDLACLRDEAAARAYLERRRWPGGRARCPRCRRPPVAFPLRPRPGSAAGARAGLWKCGACRRQFTVTVGTVLEATRLPLRKWLAAAYLTFCVPGGCEAPALAGRLSISRKTAYAVSRRFAYARQELPFLEERQRSLSRVAGALLGLLPEHRHPLAMERREALLEKWKRGL